MFKFKLWLVLFVLLVINPELKAQIFFGGTGNVAPQGVGAICVGYSYRSSFVEMMWYGRDIFSVDLALITKQSNYVLSYGGRVADDRTKDFIASLWVPKWVLKNIIVFGKAGIGLDIGPGSGRLNLNKGKCYPIIGGGFIYSL